MSMELTAEAIYALVKWHFGKTMKICSFLMKEKIMDILPQVLPE